MVIHDIFEDLSRLHFKLFALVSSDFAFVLRACATHVCGFVRDAIDSGDVKRALWTLQDWRRFLRRANGRGR